LLRFTGRMVASENTLEPVGPKVGDPFDAAMSHNPVRHGKHRRLKYQEDTREHQVEDSDAGQNIKPKQSELEDEQEEQFDKRAAVSTNIELEYDKGFDIHHEVEEHIKNNPERILDRLELDNVKQEFGERTDYEKAIQRVEPRTGTDLQREETHTRTDDVDIIIDEGGLIPITPIPMLYLDREPDHEMTLSTDNEDDIGIGSGSGDHEDHITEGKLNKTSEEGNICP